MVNYAKRAKRVDVRKLKENIWKGLDIIVPDSLTEESESELNSVSILFHLAIVSFTQFDLFEFL